MSRFHPMNEHAIALSGIQERAGFFAELAVPGPHKDKRLAAMLDCSPNMAYRLRRGEGWTADRLALAAKKFGWRWVQAVFGPIAGQGGSDVFEHEIASLRARLDVLSVGLRGGPFHDSGSGVDHSTTSGSGSGEVRDSVEGSTDAVQGGE